MPDLLMWVLELRSLDFCGNCLSDGQWNIWDISLGPTFVFQFLFFETRFILWGGWPGTYCVAYLTSDSWQFFCLSFWNVRVRYFGTCSARWNALPSSSILSSLRFSVHCGFWFSLIPQQYLHINPPFVTVYSFLFSQPFPWGSHQSPSSGSLLTEQMQK